MSISRSRKHIKNHYNMKLIGEFPKRKMPMSIYPDIDIKNEFPTYDKLNSKILKFKLSLYNPSKYVKKEFQEMYREKASGRKMAFDQKTREHFLIGMMRVNFLKRLESSIESFEISLERTIDKIKTSLTMGKGTSYDPAHISYFNSKLSSVPYDMDGQAV